MSPPAEYQVLAGSAIDLEDRTYFLAPEEEPPAPQLIASIRRHGILHPPLVQSRPGNRYMVVAGRKRLEAAVTFLHQEQVACLVVGADCPAPALHTLLLESTLLEPRPLSLAEQSTFFARLRKTATTEEILPLLALLGHRATAHHLEELLGLQDLTRAAFLALHRSTLTLAAARKLLRLPGTDQDTLVHLITRLQLGGSKQQRLVDLGTELCCRENRNLAATVAPFLQQLEAARQENMPQQAAALLAWLHGLCFPRSTRAEEEFNRKVAQLHLPATMQVAHTPSFEDDSLDLTLTFADWDALQTTLPGIRRLFEGQ